MDPVEATGNFFNNLCDTAEESFERQIMEKHIQSLWERAACAVLGQNDSVDHAGQIADAMVLEWKKRFANGK